ncbi:hypothetical protein HDV04_001167 [Boothiomyces sp. JEL0838]|nr:hypothetical protein HDV04_001167 [Boothiomyces sp. JEL0838]
MGGAWVAGDDYTWLASALFGAYWIVPLIVETLTSFKRTIMWYIIALAICCNICKVVTVLKYTTMDIVGDPDEGRIYKIYKIFDWLTFFLGDIALYYRKRMIRPIESIAFTVFGTAISFNLDIVVLVVTMVLTCVGKTACMIMDAGICWTIEGSSLYERDMGNIYSNGLWNMSSVLFPIICIDSAINSHGAMFILASKHNGDLKMTSGRESSRGSYIKKEEKSANDTRRTLKKSTMNSKAGE